jgi:hypothetical protein
MSLTPAEFARRVIVTATDFVGLVEVKQNTEWDDPATEARETAKSELLRTTMGFFGWKPGQPYCAGFDGAVVYLAAKCSGLDPKRFIDIWTAHCMTNVRRFKKLGLLDPVSQPSVGALMLMKKQGPTDSGHAGVVCDIHGKFPDRMLATVEGNTSKGKAGSQREGDGIFIRQRNVTQNGTLITQGFVSAKSLLSLMD